MDKLETVLSNYSEFQREQLQQQLHQFSTACRQIKDKDFSSLLDVVKQMNRYEKAHISQVMELFKLILVVPAKNFERPFSLLRLKALLALHKEMKFSIEDFFRKWDQIRSFLRIWSHLLKKS